MMERMDKMLAGCSNHKMKAIHAFRLLRAVLGIATILSIQHGFSAAGAENGFADLFDGQSLKGWTYIGAKGGEYFVKDGVIVCPEHSGGNLLTEGEYADFVLR